MATQALGILETHGLVSALSGADAMLKSAEVTLIGRELPGDGLVAVLIRGEVASVTAALDVGAAAAALYGAEPMKRVIPCPHPEMEKLLPTLG